MSVKRSGSEERQGIEEETSGAERNIYSQINTKYIDRFLSATSVSPKLIQMRMCILSTWFISSYPNVKEITESMAAYAHTSKFILSRMNDAPPEGSLKDVILCVGDGSTPRSAALFALFFPNWECYSIDPQLQEVCIIVIGKYSTDD